MNIEKKRRKHYKVDNLPDDVRTIVDSSLAQQEGRKPRYREIQQKILEKTNKRISIASLSRYYHGRILEEIEVNKEEATRRRAEVEQIREILKQYPNCNEKELIEQLVQLGLILNRMKLQEADPIKLLGVHRALEATEVEREKLAFEKEKLEFQKTEFQEQMEISKRKLDLAKKKEEKILNTLKKTEESGKPLTPEQVKKVREQIYGIIDQ